MKPIPTRKLWVLRHMARKTLREKAFRRARLLFSLFKWRRRTREAQAWGRAERHGNRRLLIRTVRDWRASSVEEILEASDLAERGEIFFENMVLSTHLRAWKRFVAPLRTRRVAAEGRADSCWRARTRDSLFRRWRDNVKRAKARRARWVAEVLLSVLPVEFRNSARQRPGVESAVTFHRRRALRKAWIAFLSLNEELAELQRRFRVSYVLDVRLKIVLMDPKASRCVSLVATSLLNTVVQFLGDVITSRVAANYGQNFTLVCY